MNKAGANLSVAIVGEVVCVRIVGRATFNYSIDFKRLVQELSQRGYARFVVDLSECIIMDSTFLGVLAGIGLKFCQTTNTDRDPKVELLNPNPRLKDLLENLGVSHLFRIVQQSSAADGKFEAVACENASKVELTRNCLEAHQLLMDVNPENRRRFKDVSQFLADDLKALRAGQD